jgi:peptidoglycan/xylan/chitin deacetylase (PgdA/CDA1 family)
MGGAALAILLGLFADSVSADVPRLPEIPRVAVGRVTTEEPVVAFTFDACATADQANSFDRAIFDILKREQVPTTVFLSGRWIEFHRDEARELAAEPWIEIGNHSYSHPKLTNVPVSRLLDEIERTEELIGQLGRHSVAFRPPAGVYDERIVKAAAGMKLPTVLWDVVSGDAMGHIPTDRIVDSVSRGVKAGSIVVFHINGRGPFTKEALPQIIHRLRERGFRFVRLSQLLALPGARPATSPWIQGHKIKVPGEGSEG